VGYSLVPSAMWPSVPKIVPERNLGTAYSLIYWIQNMGMLLVPIFVGRIFKSFTGVEAAERAEYIFIGLGIVAGIVAAALLRSSRRHPELALDRPSGEK
jgi:MFS family permease